MRAAFKRRCLRDFCIYSVGSEFTERTRVAYRVAHNLPFPGAIDAGDSNIPDKHWGTNSVPPDVATKNARPHTAHGLRESDIAKGRGEAAPVVAGARGMMRYIIVAACTKSVMSTTTAMHVLGFGNPALSQRSRTRYYQADE